jgi:predicted amidohydrolase
MEGITVACVQHRMSILASREEFESVARRFLRLAQAKGAHLTILPELSGLMLAPPLISGLKLGLIKRADRARQPRAGLMRRSMGGISEAAAGALGGGFRGSLVRLLDKRDHVLKDLYVEVFANLAREYATAILAGSLYLRDDESGTLRNRAYLFDSDGTVLGSQDRLNLAPDERDLASAGTDLAVFDTSFGRLGVLIGWDALYPELARLLAVQGADLIAGIVASPGAASSAVVRSALSLRAEENQVFVAASFLLGPNYLGEENREEYVGHSAVLAPISLTGRGDGILVQTGTNRSEGLIAATLDLEALQALRQSSRFRPRQEMALGSLGPVLAEMYQKGLTIEQAIEQRIAGPAAVAPKPFQFVAQPSPEPLEATEEVPASPVVAEEPQEAPPAPAPLAEPQEAPPAPEPPEQPQETPPASAPPEEMPEAEPAPEPPSTPERPSEGLAPWASEEP